MWGTRSELLKNEYTFLRPFTFKTTTFTFFRASLCVTTASSAASAMQGKQMIWLAQLSDAVVVFTRIAAPAVYSRERLKNRFIKII